MKKFLSLLLVVMMVFSLAACGKKEAVEPSTEATTEANASAVEGAPATPEGQLIIGTTTEMSGDWITAFTNNAADFAVLQFISGYSTVDQTFAGEFVKNDTAVKELATTDNADGTKTFTWTLNENLTYNDGTKITAKDYIASVLLWNSPFLVELGSAAQDQYKLMGYKEYQAGTSDIFTGARLLGDYQFSVTVAKEELPFFYDITAAAVGPTPLHYWLKDSGIEVKDDGQGAYFSTRPTKAANEATFLAARNNPKYVSSGAYNVESYDAASQTVVLKVNPSFLGDYTGQTAKIETVIYRKVVKDTQMDELATGKVDLLSFMMQGTEIQTGLDLVDKGGFNFTNYPRSGYGKVTFVCDFGPTQFPEVRHAIAHLLDRNDFAKTFTGGFGTIVNGPYGESQWFYQETKAELNEKLNQYPYGFDLAVKELEAGGWTLDEKGGAYVSGIRYKKLDDGTLMPLILEWASSEQNAVSDLLVVKLKENPDVAAAGFKINQTVMTFPELLNYYSRNKSVDAKYGVPTYNMYNLAVTFTPQYDLTTTYTTDPTALEGGSNPNFLIDKKLEDMAKAMVKRDGTDREGFKKDFVTFVTYWNELLPDMPLYSNIIHDFYTDKLKNYNANALVNISQAVLYAYVAK